MPPCRKSLERMMGCGNFFGDSGYMSPDLGEEILMEIGSLRIS